MKFIVAGFLGANKALEPKMLPSGGVECPVGVDSFNQKPGRGDLRPWKIPLTVATVPSSRKTIYRMGRDVVNDALYWLSWTTIVHAIRGFIASDTTERTYFTGDGAPKVTDNTIGLSGTPYPTTSRILGVPAATTPMTITLDTAGATGDDIEFFFTQTFVTDRGEESKPGPITAFTEKIDAIIDISDLESAPAGNYGITLRRIYVTMPGQGNDGEFFLLKEQAVAGSTALNQDLATSAVVLQSNGPVNSVGRAWDVPPSDLKHLTAMWDGMMAGISGRSVRYPEPYRPHAWPIAYETLPPDVTPVALCVWDKNLLILTNGRPYLVTGSHPTNLGDDPVSLKQSCIGERSAVAMRDGAAWSAPDGLAYYGNSKAGIVTEGLMTRDDWQALKPETIIGTQYEGRYMGLYDLGGGSLKAFMIDPQNPTGVFFLDTGYLAAFFDELTDSLYVLDGTNVKKWDAGASFMTATFKSKVFRTARPTNMGWLEVTATSYPVSVTITAQWYDSAGTLRTSTESRSVPSSNPVALKAGFLADQWQIEVGTAGAVQGIVLAETIGELRAT
jgi:hypothetical protein